MQFRETLNNSINALIRKSSNKITYEMKLNEKLNVFDVIVQN